MCVWECLPFHWEHSVYATTSARPSLKASNALHKCGLLDRLRSRIRVRIAESQLRSYSHGRRSSHSDDGFGLGFRLASATRKDVEEGRWVTHPHSDAYLKERVCSVSHCKRQEWSGDRRSTV